MPKHKFFTVCYGVILVLLIIWLLMKVQVIFTPVVIAFQTLFFPFLIAGVLFYLFRPLIEFLSSKKIPRILAIILLFLSLVAIFVAISLIIGPVLQQQVSRLIANSPQIADALREQWAIFESNRADFPDYIKDGIDYAISKGQEILAGIGGYLGKLLGFITNVIVILIIVPFILFYLLKDGKKAPDQLLSLLPKDQVKEGKSILSDMNKALSTYVQGQVIVSLCVGVMVYIGYLIIGIEYSLILAIVAMLTNVIPFVGPFIGVLPALIVGLIESPMMMLWVIVVVVIVQQIESNLISPQIMGRVLEVHPLTIILLLLVASSLGGLLGLIIAVPAYAMLKVIFKHAYHFYRLKVDLKE
jgi:predicted PurR-regulated permease PerM